jgi:membrane protein YdbS with pleckstrin-like domain
MQCPVCDAPTVADAAFCPKCGAKLPAVSSEPPVSATPPRETYSTIKVPKDTAEEVLWEGSYSPKAMLGTFVLCGILSVALLIGALLLPEVALVGALMLAAIPVLWIAAGIQLLVRKLSISYKLTNHRFFHRQGLLSRVTDRIELIEIHDVTWRQGLIERAIGVGTITIASADRTHPKLPLAGIDNVEAVADTIDKARRAEQIRRGRRIDFSNIDHQT